MATSSTALRRSQSDKVLAGVLGGIARHFGWDPTVVRAVYVVFSIVSVAFPGILVYLALYFVIPEEGGAG